MGLISWKRIFRENPWMQKSSGNSASGDDANASEYDLYELSIGRTPNVSEQEIEMFAVVVLVVAAGGVVIEITSSTSRCPSRIGWPRIVVYHFSCGGC